MSLFVHRLISSDSLRPLGKIALWVLPLVVAGLFYAYRERPPSPRVVEARTLLQCAKFQQALDVLEPDPSAESRYLRAAALNALRLPQPAREQIDLALAREKRNIKYRGFKLRLDLYEGKKEAVEELIRLHEENRSSGALAFFAFYAHGAQRAVHLSQKQFKEALRSSEAALAAVIEAIALSAEIPEFQRELLEVAIALQLGAEAESLLVKLRAAAPHDPVLAKDRIEALLLAGRADAALTQAREFYLERNDEEAAMAYATALATAKANPERDFEFREIVSRYPANPALVSLEAVYLAKSKRLPLASQALAESIAKQTNPSTRQHLMRIAVYLPLEEGDAGWAESELNRYRVPIADRLLIAYFEGRILYLRKDYPAALARLNKVVEGQKELVDSHRALAREALTFIDRILADQAEAKRLGTASTAVKGLKQGGEKKSPDAGAKSPR
jgi:hypothetical protein